jgi:hypothetical protein
MAVASTVDPGGESGVSKNGHAAEIDSMTSSYKKQVVIVVDFGRFKVRHGCNSAPSHLGG